ncbi:bacteriorhodopsin [Exiguobacterium indicum]|uniref:Rhodopsin n=1 Tax=Exiguobacterium indicum TaxID=296995 RepID=A0AAW3MFS4_9BACL|nr:MULTISPECIES: bacteriorhodopsin [Exiguobacterium]AHA29715.1 rhodopsin [Exiguobacterium sp. MH3]KTR27681.1 rhodopsin [Exiguobacterium indicum]MCQ4090351.1 bacteriorhodopsin-like [Exiguobacterium sp. LL15]
MEDVNLLVLATQYMFWVGFVGMAAGTLYFLVERNSLAPEYRSTATVAALVTFVAAIHYYFMKQAVGESGLLSEIDGFPTEIRYIDWLVTTPLLLIKFPLLLGLKGGKGRSLLTKLVIADIIMIIGGYIGESSINLAGGFTQLGLWAYVVGCVAWFYIIYLLFTNVTKAAEDKPAPIRKALLQMRLFILIGWAIYPVGYAVTLFAPGIEVQLVRELIYNFADLINKVGFGLIAFFAVKTMSATKNLKST